MLGFVMTFRTHKQAAEWIKRQTDAMGIDAFARRYDLPGQTIRDILTGKSKTITAKVATALKMTLAYGRKEW